jgi:hypothetical protein
MSESGGNVLINSGGDLVLTPAVSGGNVNLYNDTGGLVVNSSVTSTGGFFDSSDIRYKNVLETNPKIDLSSIDVIKFVRNDREDQADKVRYGYSAQQIQEILPDLVDKDIDGKLTLNYQDTHTILIKYLLDKIKDLENELIRLRG